MANSVDPVQTAPLVVVYWNLWSMKIYKLKKELNSFSLADLLLFQDF